MMISKLIFKPLVAVSAFLLAGVAQAATVSYVTVPPTLPFTDPGYTPNGSITATVADTPDCTGGTFTVNASPIAASGPGGSNPPLTTVVTYIGFPAGNFLFANAGYGGYRITTTTTACAAGTPPAPIVNTVAVLGASAATAIPTISEWGMIIMSSLLALLAVFTLRRHKI
ncbi:MAG: IPTL-CTERM sorting domain-containing protein [Rhodocyclaceae bacterium]|jgi:hypothetical protein|nr:IPTL-CTERM sorting domain-containing protein [Rhodocyclaceae bacterium]MBK6555011.1 IPTL-CTERM sorting domain-containing protein [Rhodocyclaceae bacterium]MBK9309709.1 IPTL-CTERM sorting domain-containing protein [Rhodocyclaceae bacterium]MBK9955203.1 IPTL-CTERM sorting domain-containing protein [Rhodocyclaceae bacterium]